MLDTRSLAAASTLVGMISTGVVAVATVVLVILTARYVRFTSAMVAEMKATREPAVFLDIEFPKVHDLLLVVGNSGLSPAQHLKFECEDTVPWLAYAPRSGLLAIDTLKDGLSYLAPGRVLKFHLGAPDWDAIATNGGRLSVGVTFTNEDRKPFQRTASIDLKQYVQVSPASFSPPGSDIAKAIESTERAGAIDRFTSRLLRASTKSCSMCAEQIPAAARKCSHCGELQPERKSES